MKLIRYFAYEGAFVESKEHRYPAFTFTKTEDKEYWMYVGNNTAFGNYKLFKTREDLTDEVPYLEIDSKMLPMQENNFARGGRYKTFRESFNNQLYIISKGELVPSYRVSFGELGIPASLLSMEPMEVLPKLKNSHWASVYHYCENASYLYLQVMENIPDSENASFYHWIVNKKTKWETIVRQEQVTADSYLFAPQYLSDDNQLFFMGYLLEKETDVADSEKNPSVIVIDLSSF